MPYSHERAVRLAAMLADKPGLTITLNAKETAAIGATDAELLGAEVRTVLRGFAYAREHGMSRPSADLLATIESLSARLAGLRSATIRAHIAAGTSHRELADLLGRTRSTAQKMRADLGDPDGAERWATGQYAPVDHPGIPVPAELVPWVRGWPGYLPVDITPPKLRADALANPEGWVGDTVTDPGELSTRERSERHRAALVPFGFDSGWRPLNPEGRTGRGGRNHRRWGENACADPIVVTGHGADRRVLLIKRADRGVWAFPGGHIDPGEEPTAAAIREAGEDTGVDLSGVDGVEIARTYVADWRNTDHAWSATAAVVFEVPAELPATGADDATDARWFPFPEVDPLGALTAAIEATGGDLYDAHRPLLVVAALYLKGELNPADQGGTRELIRRIREGEDIAL